MANGSESRKDVQPVWAATTQDWAGHWVANSHYEALFQFGEFLLFTLMWTVADFEQGLVGRCQSCFVNDRHAEAYQQANQIKCPDCYGTTFEGGFRAQIVRPAIIMHDTPELEQDIRGEVVRDDLSLETTTDFTFNHGDYLFRANGSRYQGDDKQEDAVMGGFQPQDQESNFHALIPNARLEDPTSVAWTIPVLVGDGNLTNLLDRSNFGVHTYVADDVIRTNGYL